MVHNRKVQSGVIYASGTPRASRQLVQSFSSLCTCTWCTVGKCQWENDVRMGKCSKPGWASRIHMQKGKWCGAPGLNQCREEQAHKPLHATHDQPPAGWRHSSTMCMRGGNSITQTPNHSYRTSCQAMSDLEHCDVRYRGGACRCPRYISQVPQCLTHARRLRVWRCQF
jgi:hypothetical protein